MEIHLELVSDHIVPPGRIGYFNHTPGYHQTVPPGRVACVNRASGTNVPGYRHTVPPRQSGLSYTTAA